MEAHVIPGKESFPAALARLRERWTPHFPIAEEAVLFKVSVAARPQAGSYESRHWESPLSRFFSPDRTLAVQAAPHLFAANDRTRGEPGWEKLFPVFAERLQDYYEVMAPKGIERCVLRYLNELILPEGESLAEYLTWTPSILRGRAPGPLELMMDLTEQGGQVVATGFVAFQGWLEEPQKKAAKYQFNLVAQGLFAQAIGPDEAAKWAADAHTELVHVFEAAITDKAREFFGEEAAHEH